MDNLTLLSTFADAKALESALKDKIAELDSEIKARFDGYTSFTVTDDAGCAGTIELAEAPWRWGDDEKAELLGSLPDEVIDLLVEPVVTQERVKSVLLGNAPVAVAHRATIQTTLERIGREAKAAQERSGKDRMLRTKLTPERKALAVAAVEQTLGLTADDAPAERLPAEQVRRIESVVSAADLP